MNIINLEDFHCLLNTNKHHLDKLHEIVANTGEPLEGNCFYLHQTLNTDARLVNKQRNIYSLARVSQQILEIGFNAGHSSLIMLLANPQAEITAFDICWHKYTQLCFDYLAEVFPRRIKLIPGSSTETIPLYYQQHPQHKFDLLHIDGSHEKEIANSDFHNCMQLAKHKSYVIWDDVQSTILKGLWDEYVKLGYVQPVAGMLETYLYQHIVGQYLIPPQPVETTATKTKQLINSLSVIIPAYNCEKYISLTLESIITSLDYFHAHYPLAEQVKSEIIVVNDCSSDNTTFFVSQFIGKKYIVKLLNHTVNQGAGPARNTGFKNSQGEILFFCDGDDLFLPTHIYVCFMLLQGPYDQKNTFPLVQDNYQAQVTFLEQPVDAIKTKVKIAENIHPAWQQGIENSLPLNLCVRRGCHEFLEGFPEHPIYKQIGGEDSAYYRYLREFFKIAYVNLVTVQYIRYPGNSLDRQMPKFSQPPGAYQGPLPHEKPELRAESHIIEQKRLEVLKEKYQRFYNNMQNIVSPVQELIKTDSSQLKTIIITASDVKYFPLAKGTILSIRDQQVDQNTAIGFLDLGCHSEQLQWLKNQVNFICKPDWHFNFPAQNQAPEHLKGLLARPFLREYFPGFDIYIWIDADAWVQKWDAIELLIQGANKKELAIAYELDRGYYQFYDENFPDRWAGPLQWYRDTHLPESVIQKIYQFPMINAGVFAIRQSSSLWQAWAEELGKAVQKKAWLLSDQMVLNYLIYRGGFFASTEFLPAWCNWICMYGLPVWDREASCFVEPYLPHTPIGILHLAGPAKRSQVNLLTTNNDLVSMSLLYQEKDHKVTTGRYDYVSAGFKNIKLDPAFPHMIIGNTDQQPWQYLRREIPHNWYVDGRHPFVGFLSRDEAHILYNTALKFTGKRALEIGCWMGWSACHLIAAGVNLDIVDPMLDKPEFQQSVINSLQATTRITGISTEVSINAGYSPQAVLNLASQHERKWSLIFIDGNHDTPGPLNDAIACEPLAEDTAMVLFHDLASPDVAQGLDYLQQKGWKTMVYQTMQIMGVAWRGDIEPVKHQPDPQVNWVLPKHLAHHPVSNLVSDPHIAPKNLIQKISNIQNFSTTPLCEFFYKYNKKNKSF